MEEQAESMAEEDGDVGMRKVVRREKLLGKVMRGKFKIHFGKCFRSRK